MIRARLLVTLLPAAVRSLLIRPPPRMRATGLQTRRDNIRTTLAVPTSAFLLSNAGGRVATSTPNAADGTVRLPSVHVALDLIDRSCNRRFLHAVVASDYHFLYRGLPPDDGGHPTIRSEPCDLLELWTYGSDRAVAHFRDLDDEMRASGSPVLPSNGHLAVTCPDAAAEWGVAASIWPLGEEGVHFAWYESGGEFWPRLSAGGRGTEDDLVVDAVDCGRVDLEDALVGDRWEVLFRADRGFLAVPMSLEKELREGLRRSLPV